MRRLQSRKPDAYQVSQSLGSGDKMCENPDVNFPNRWWRGRGGPRPSCSLDSCTPNLNPKAIRVQGAVGSLATPRSEYQERGEEGCPEQQAVPRLESASVVRCPKCIHTHIHIKPVYKAESGPRRVARPR